MTTSTELAGFLGKWQARWPEWSVGAAFLQPAQRPLAFAWLALLQEFTDAAWGGADATPGLAKLAWWSDELRGWSKGARRHPLGEALHKRPLDWDALAAALRTLQAARGHEAAAPELAACARVLADAESRLLGGAACPQLIAADLGAEHAMAHGDLAAARALRPSPAAAAGGARARALHSAFLHLRLRRSRDGEAPRPAPAWRLLPVAWRAARRGE